MTETEPATAARAAAARLADQYGSDLPMQVETAIHRDPDAPPDQYLDPISLGGLIVSIATLAWTVYKDLKAQGQRDPAPETVARTVRIELEHPSDLPPEQRSQVISVTVEEVVNAAAAG